MEDEKHESAPPPVAAEVGGGRRWFSLDLDSTFVCSSEEMKDYIALHLHTDASRQYLLPRIYRFDMIDVTSTPGTGIKTQMWGVLRPWAHEFLRLVSNQYNLVIWSAGQYKYVHAISEILFPYAEGGLQPAGVFTWEDCERDSDDEDAHLCKPLTKLYAKFPDANPTNTFALDDRESTFEKNPDNGILIPPYEPEPTLEGIIEDDIALLQLYYWLCLPDVQSASDVRSLDKSSIFTTPLSVYQRLTAPAAAEAEPQRTPPPPPPSPVSPPSFFPSVQRVPRSSLSV